MWSPSRRSRPRRAATRGGRPSAAALGPLLLALLACPPAREGPGPEPEAELVWLFERVSDSGDAEAERRPLRALAAWLAQPRPDHPAGYRLRLFPADDPSHLVDRRWIERRAADGTSVELLIECPCFPPRTPWIRHRFHDPRNLTLLAELLLDR